MQPTSNEGEMREPQMSLKLIKTFFDELTSLTSVNLKLLKFEEDAKEGMVYTSQEITLYPSDLMKNLLEDVKKEYTKKAGRLGRYTAVDPYDGSMIGTTIYSLDCTDPLIKTAYEHMLVSLAKPQTEGRPMDFKANAYLLQGDWEHEGGVLPIKLIALMNPFTKLKHKFAYDGKTFKEISEDVLDLRLYMDVVVIGKQVFFFGLSGEKLFGMERAYQTHVTELAVEFEKVSFLTNADNLKKTALSGHYPRMLVAYQASKMKYLDTPGHRRTIAKKFGIDIDKKDNFDMGKPDCAAKLIRFLCNKGMLDPTDEAAMEVAGAKRWV